MKTKVILHPILFGLYPVLFAYTHNIDFAPPRAEVIILLVLAGCCAAMLWGALALVTGDVQKTAIGVSVFILLFFSYGHLVSLIGVPLAKFRIYSISFGENRAPAFVWIVVALAAARWLKTLSPVAVGTATLAFNRAAAALVLLVALNLLGTLNLMASVHLSGVTSAVAARSTQTLVGKRDLPDIYYIILDDYARADILKDVYQYDNTAMLDWLRARGFYVADQSHSNYSQTMLSLASSLNSEYLEAPQLRSASTDSDPSWHVALNVAAARYFEKGRAYGIDGSGLTSSRLPLAHMIQYSNTLRTLKDHGYRFAAFTSGYGGVQLPNADKVVRAEVFDDFEESLISATPIPRVFERLYDPIELHRQRVRYVFDHLADRLGDGTPLFVFAHILCPHTPFAFEADGTSVQKSQVILDDRLASHGEGSRNALVKAYRSQVQFVNQRIESAIATILARSPRPPIIILQSDHGSEMTLDQSNPSAAGIRERMSILNAYYVPDDIRAQLYPEISPVNTFRIILGRYFPGAWTRLPDESYFSTWASPYKFVPVNGLLGQGKATSDGTAMK
jgi:hypothetical protein